MHVSFPSRTCVSRYGASCIECDTSDIPAEGVPIGGDTTSASDNARHESAIGTGAVPIGVGQQSYPPFNAQYYPRQQQGYGGYNQYAGYGSQFGSQYGGQYGSQYQPYGGGYGYQRDQGSYHGYQDQSYSSYGYGYRSRRSTRKRTKPVEVVTTPNWNPDHALISLAPMLKMMMNGSIEYRVMTKNDSLFEMRYEKKVVSLHATQQLTENTTHYVVILGHIKKSSVARELRKILKDSRAFQLRVIVRVLPAKKKKKVVE